MSTTRSLAAHLAAALTVPFVVACYGDEPAGPAGLDRPIPFPAFDYTASAWLYEPVCRQNPDLVLMEVDHECDVLQPPLDSAFAGQQQTFQIRWLKFGDPSSDTDTTVFGLFSVRWLSDSTYSATFAGALFADSVIVEDTIQQFYSHSITVVHQEGDVKTEISGYAAQCSKTFRNSSLDCWNNATGFHLEPHLCADNPADATFENGLDACHGLEELPMVDPTAIRVTTSWTGEQPDANGYNVKLIGPSLVVGLIGAEDILIFAGIESGTYSVELTDVASNCSIDGDNPVEDVTVGLGDTASVSFLATCTAQPDPGTLEILTSTDGEDQDTDGYTVLVDDVVVESIGLNDTIRLALAAPGNYSVALGDLDQQCYVVGDNPVAISISENDTASVQFTVDCPTELSGGIVGSSTVKPDVACSYTMLHTSTVSPYTYEWFRDGELVSTAGKYVANTGTSDFDLIGTVSDASGQFASDTLLITIDPEAASCLSF